MAEITAAVAAGGQAAQTTITPGSRLDFERKGRPANGGEHRLSATVGRPAEYNTFGKYAGGVFLCSRRSTVPTGGAVRRTGELFMRAILATACLALCASSVSASVMITPAQIAEKREKDKGKLLRMSPADFQRTVQITDDDLETVATLSTVKGFRSLGGLVDMVRADVFLRAHVNKLTGSASYQVYETIMYRGDDRRYETVNFQDGDAIGTAELTQVSHVILDCDPAYRYFGCSRSVDFAFDVPETLLKRVAAAPADRFWRFKFRAQAGDDWEDMISPAEASGLLAAVAAFRDQRHLP